MDLEKAPVLTENDVTSRIGTKHAAKECNPIVYLTEFDERAERAGASSKP